MTPAQLLDKMSDLESRIALIYERFVTLFREAVSVGDLWQSMGREELHHADLLARLARGTDVTLEDGRLEEHVRKLAAVVSRCENEQAPVISLPQALAMTADLEEAEAEPEQDGGARDVTLGVRGDQHAYAETGDDPAADQRARIPRDGEQDEQDEPDPKEDELLGLADDLSEQQGDADRDQDRAAYPLILALHVRPPSKRVSHVVDSACVRCRADTGRPPAKR